MQISARMLLGVALVSLFGGCSKKPREALVDIQVFIVTKSAANIKLGLVNVRALPFDKARSAVQQLAGKRQNAVTQFKKDVASLEEENAFQEQRFLDRVKRHEDAITALRMHMQNISTSGKDAGANFAKVVKQALAAADAYVSSVAPVLKPDNIRIMNQTSEERYNAFKEKFLELNSVLGNDLTWDKYLLTDGWANASFAEKIVSTEAWQGIPQHRDAVLIAAARLKAEIEPARLSYEHDLAKIEELKKNAPSADTFRNEYARKQALLKYPVFLSHEIVACLNPASVSAKTDADGRCQLRLPLNQRWVITASAARQLGAQLEEYIWIVELPQSQESSLSFSLSNDNLLSKGKNALLSEFSLID